jgi:hypothetical protein
VNSVASLHPPEQPFDWATLDEPNDGLGIALGWLVAGFFAIAASLLGFLVIYAALV